MAPKGKNHPLGPRIRRILQDNEDIGKLATTVPNLIGEICETFIEGLVQGAKRVSEERGGKILTASHLKVHVQETEELDFVRELLKSVPDLGAERTERDTSPKAAGGKRKGAAGGKAAAGGSGAKKGGKKRKASDSDLSSLSSDDVSLDGDSEDEAPHSKPAAAKKKSKREADLDDSMPPLPTDLPGLPGLPMPTAPSAGGEGQGSGLPELPGLPDLPTVDEPAAAADLAKKMGVAGAVGAWAAAVPANDEADDEYD